MNDATCHYMRNLINQCWYCIIKKLTILKNIDDLYMENIIFTHLKLIENFDPRAV